MRVPCSRVHLATLDAFETGHDAPRGPVLPIMVILIGRSAVYLRLIQRTACIILRSIVIYPSRPTAPSCYLINSLITPESYDSGFSNSTRQSILSLSSSLFRVLLFPYSSGQPGLYHIATLESIMLSKRTPQTPDNFSRYRAAKASTARPSRARESTSTSSSRSRHAPVPERRQRMVTPPDSTYVLLPYP